MGEGPVDAGAAPARPLPSRREVMLGAMGGVVALRMPRQVRAARPQAVVTQAPEDVGEWSGVLPGFFDTIPIHGAVLRTGKVLLFQNTAGYLWDPVDDSAVAANPGEDLFCAGHTFLGNGDVFCAGGVLGSPPFGPRWTWFFRASTGRWRKGPDMRQGRYYPTCTTLPHGEVLITTGTDETGAFNEDVELLTGSTLSLVSNKRVNLYPHQWLLPDGKVVMTGPRQRDVAILDPATWMWTTVPDLLANRHDAGGFMKPTGPGGSFEVIRTGGHNNTVEVLDCSNPTAGWTFLSSLPEIRSDMNTTLLPDGTVLGVGGQDQPGGAGATPQEPRLQSLLYTPNTDTWVPVATQTMKRAYHSIALLLPDGRVLSTGDNSEGAGRDTREIYSPPYLFRGSRPTITKASSSVAPGQVFLVKCPDSVARVVLMRPGSCTHSNNMSQLHIELAFTVAGDLLRVTAPPSNNVAPVGYYMLFVLSPDGVPSVARWIRITAG